MILKKNLNQELEERVAAESKNMKTVGIIGMGYVGKSMKRLFEHAFNIVFYDIKTFSFPEQLKSADLLIISVPTPMSEDGSCDVSAINSAAKTAIENNDHALICIKSAVPPGTTDRLNREFNTDRFHVSPEYVGEGTRFVAPWKYPDPLDSRSHNFIIVGGPRASEVLDFFARVMAADARYIICKPIEAELTKRFENAFLATKVTFVNEAAKICEAFNVDWKSVRELWLLDERIGRSHTAVFKDEPGYGGKCLPKDMSALIAESEEVGYTPNLLNAVRNTNKIIRQETNI